VKILMEKTTDAKVSNTISLGNDPDYTAPAVPYTFCLSGVLAADEEITFQYFDGDNWIDMKETGTNIVLSADTNIVSIYAPLTIRVNKPATASAAGVLVAVVRGA